MKKLFYYFIKYIIKLTSLCYFRKIRIYGLEKIPKQGGVLFSPNHQGAFLDPLLVGCNIPAQVTSLTRSDVFGGPLQWFMDALKMLPIYRIRNGYSNLRKNEAIFQRCKNLLSKNQMIMMFSEASHHDEYYLQALSKGSSRLAFEAQENSDNPVYIVPVGINYGHHRNPFCDLHLVFGEPILIKTFTKKKGDKPELINRIKESLRLGMKKCLWLPNNDQYYQDRKKLIHDGNTKKSFEEIKKGIEDQSLAPKNTLKKQSWKKMIVGLFSIPNLPPLLIIKKVLGLFEDIVFYSSIKMSAGMILFVLWWLIIFTASNVMWGPKIGLLTTISCISLLYVRQILSNKFY